VDNVPSGHHTWAQLLTLVGAVRRLAFDHTLPAPEALGRIRDAFTDYDQQGVCDNGPSEPPTAAPRHPECWGAVLCAL
jgi:hypothetical protein